MATTILEQLHEKYVGEMVELFTIDLLPIGINVQYYLTNTSADPVTFQKKVYIPFPIECTNISRSATAPGRVTLRVSNVTSLLATVVQQYGDIIGAEVKRIRTFSNFLTGAVNADNGQHFPIETYTIIKNLQLPELIEFVCTKLDRPGNIPRRQILRDNVRGALYCPGVARSDTDHNKYHPYKKLS